MESSSVIKISQNRRYFIDASGNPFFWLADTAWPLFNGYSKAEVETYLKDRAEKGFTVIQAIPSWEGSGNVHTSLTRPDANYEGRRLWDKDPGNPDEKFLSDMDRVIHLAGELGLVLAIFPVWGPFVNDSKVVNASNAKSLGLKLGKHYRDFPNIVWVSGGDHDARGFEDVYRNLALGLREGDEGKHLITFHPNAWRSSSQYFNDENWLDFHMIETWQEWPQTHPSVLSDLVRLPIRPVVLGECAYENGPEYGTGPITAHVMRKQAWWTFMAGGFFTYGQDRMWRMGEGWINTLDTPGAKNMTQFRTIASKRDWWKMIPDQSVFGDGVSSGRTLNTALWSTDDTCMMIYLSSQCNVMVHLEKIRTKTAKALWINPVTGEERDGGVHETGNEVEGKDPAVGKCGLFSVPLYWEDAVLIIDAIK